MHLISYILLRYNNNLQHFRACIARSPWVAVILILSHEVGELVHPLLRITHKRKKGDETMKTISRSRVVSDYGGKSNL